MANQDSPFGLRAIGKIGQTKFGVFLAEPFSALSFPCPRFQLFCCCFFTHSLAISNFHSHITNIFTNLPF